MSSLRVRQALHALDQLGLDRSELVELRAEIDERVTPPRWSRVAAPLVGAIDESACKTSEDRARAEVLVARIQEIESGQVPTITGAELLLNVRASLAERTRAHAAPRPSRARRAR